MVVLICICLIISDIKHLFHISIGHLYVFFGEVSIQVLCPFFDWLDWFIGVEFCKFFINFGY